MTAVNTINSYPTSKQVQPFPVPADPDFVATSGANAAVSITLDADTLRPIILGQVTWSYSAAPTGGRITVEDGSGVVVWDAYVTAGGYQSHTFSQPIHGTKNTNMIITAAAGGGALTSKIAVNAWKHL